MPEDADAHPFVTDSAADALFGAALPAAVDALTPGELSALLPDYEIVRVLGSGGMGVVYLARHRRHDRFVALKLLSAKYGGDPEFIARFEREARAMARLAHPNIVTAFDAGHVGEGRLYFTMEYVEGTNLAELIRGGAPLDVAAIGEQMCDALEYAHGAGIIHRDIKPANVLVDAQGRVKVADFGLARLIGADVDASALTSTGIAMGTLGYMSPEQRRGEAVDQRADLFSLGAVFYEMLCRDRPVGMFATPSSRVGCDPRWDAIVNRAMQADPARRYASTTELRAALDDIRTTSAPPRAAKRRRLALVAGVFVIVVLAGFFAWQKLKPAPVVLSLPLSGNVKEPQAYPNPKRWVDQMPRLREFARVFGGGEEKGERLRIKSSCSFTMAQSRKLADVAVRVVGKGRIFISLRVNPSDMLHFTGGIEEDGTARIEPIVAAGTRPPEVPAEPVVLDPAFDRTAEHEIVFAVKGDVFSLWVDRSLIVSVRDSATIDGLVALRCWGVRDDAAAPVIKSMECADLSATPVEDQDIPFPKQTAGSAADILTSPDYRWSEPVNLGPVVNSAKFDTGPAVTGDGLRVVVSTDPNDQDLTLVELRRESLDEPFGAPAIFRDVRPLRFDLRAWISADGLKMLHVARHPERKTAIVERRRPALDAPWGPPSEIEAPNGVSGYRENAWLSPDGLTLLYNSQQPDGVGAKDLWRARRKSTDTTFEAPELLGFGINTDVQEYYPFQSADGTALLFVRQLLSTSLRSYLYLAVPDAQGRFHVRPLDWPLKGKFATPWLSPDGRTLWFSWDGPGGQGSMDIWEIRRVPK